MTLNLRRQLGNRECQRLQTCYGPWAVVTGASSGIGRELALMLATAGLNLVLVARSQAVLEQMAEDLRTQAGIEVRVVGLDFTRESGVETLGAAICDLEVGLLVASAGFGSSGSLLATDLESALDMLKVNCQSLLALSWFFGRRFAQQGRGGIVLMSSIVGFQGMPLAAHYAATKAYVHTLGEALAVEMAPLGIDMLVSAPGPTQSGFAARAGMRLGMALQPSVVAEATLRALGRRSTVLPGGLSKLLVYSMVLLPRWVRVRIMGGVMASMTMHSPTPQVDFVKVE